MVHARTIANLLQLDRQALAAFAVLLASCGQNDRISQIFTDDVAKADGFPIYVALSPEAGSSSTLYFSSEHKGGAMFLCETEVADACVESRGVGLQAIRGGDAERSFFRTPQPVVVAAGKRFVVKHQRADGTVGQLLFSIGTRGGGTPPPGGGDPIAGGLQLIVQQNLNQHMAYLASQELAGRDTGAPGNDEAAKWLAQQMAAVGMQPGVSGEWLQSFSAQGRRTNNIIGIFPGQDDALKDEYIIIGAHMDHVGSRACSGGGLCLGADDNASGTVAVLNVAKAMAPFKSQLKRTVVFIFFSGEEMGLLGAYHYTREPVFPLRQTIHMVNLDMVGYLRGGKMDAFGAAASPLAMSIIDRLDEKYSSINVNPTRSAGGGSDHVPFGRVGVAATFFHTGGHDCVHRSCDTPDKINYQGMTEVTKFLYEFSYALANASQSNASNYLWQQAEAAWLMKSEASYSLITGESHSHVNPGLASMDFESMTDKELEDFLKLSDPITYE